MIEWFATRKAQLIMLAVGLTAINFAVQCDRRTFNKGDGGACCALVSGNAELIDAHHRATAESIDARNNQRVDEYETSEEDRKRIEAKVDILTLAVDALRRVVGELDCVAVGDLTQIVTRRGTRDTVLILSQVPDVVRRPNQPDTIRAQPQRVRFDYKAKKWLTIPYGVKEKKVEVKP